MPAANRRLDQVVLNPSLMIAYRLEDLVVWQLANQLKLEVYVFTAKPPASRDYKYCYQIRDAAASVTRNTAEGFGYFRPKQFRNFLAIAAASLQEVKDELHDGVARGYLSADDHLRLLRLTLRALKANRRLQAYLATCKSHENSRETPPKAELRGGRETRECRRPRGPSEPREP